ncbi:MAG: ABC transporter ATP-binding protein [Desulfobacterales bacterium]|nr:ABC transporter ATP-binding protein [Desulfobacterales bacterium]MDD4073255.1 ABC transporter ATP-binding protein [Desulfobacterales bacterium]MDD4391759.1 ABC transporter ATP-binding protein [Desulfobacterales bacterium]
MTLISVDHVTYGYSRKPVLKDISLTFKRGEIVSLLGPNGSGKTTFLKILLGLYRPQEGRVLFEGRSVSEIPPKQIARRIAYVPQSHRLAFGYRVMDVVLMGRIPHKPFFFQYSNDDQKAALDALERLSIDHLKDRPYTEVSGGERQMTLIARAIVQGADIFIMDEPVNGLDYGNQIRLLYRITDLARHGYTFIKTTHFPDHALWFSDRVVMLKAGKVIADGDALQMINRINLYNLYNTHIKVIELDDGAHICIPDGLRGQDNHCAPNDSFKMHELV